MRHPIKAAIIAFGALGALAGRPARSPIRTTAITIRATAKAMVRAMARQPVMVRAMVRATTKVMVKVMTRVMHRAMSGRPGLPGYAGLCTAPARTMPAPTPGYGPPAYDPYSEAYASSGYGYCDPYCGCPDDYYDLPVYDGAVFLDGGWYNGPFFWRDYRRPPRILDPWRLARWPIPRRPFRRGTGPRLFPAAWLGHFCPWRQLRRPRSFGARGSNFGHQNFARVAPQRSFQQPAFNGFRGGFAGRSSFNAQPQQLQRLPGAAPGVADMAPPVAAGFQGHFQQQAQVQHGGGGWTAAVVVEVSMAAAAAEVSMVAVAVMAAAVRHRGGGGHHH